jgi:AcrR family transcriptional regulator
MAGAAGATRTVVAHDGEHRVDGRSQRSERSRRAAVEALLDLVNDGEARPTAQQIAERSGVSLSTIFRLYDDLDALNAAAIAAQRERIAPLIVPLDAEGSLTARIDQWVDTRAKLYEAISPVRRFAKGLAPTSDRLTNELRSFDRFLSRQATDLFAPERAGEPHAGVVAELVDALTSWDTWDRLRRAQGLSVRKAKATVAEGLHRVLVSSDTER